MLNNVMFCFPSNSAQILWIKCNFSLVVRLTLENTTRTRDEGVVVYQEAHII